MLSANLLINTSCVFLQIKKHKQIKSRTDHHLLHEIPDHWSENPTPGYTKRGLETRPGKTEAVTGRMVLYNSFGGRPDGETLGFGR